MLNNINNNSIALTLQESPQTGGGVFWGVSLTNLLLTHEY